MLRLEPGFQDEATWVRDVEKARGLATSYEHAEPSVLPSEALFIDTIEAAATILSGGNAAKPAARRRQQTQASRGGRYEQHVKVMDASEIRLAEVIAVLRAPAGAGARDAQMRRRAFAIVARLLPNQESLLLMLEQDQERAIRELTLELETLGQTMEAKATQELDGAESTTEDQERFAKLANTLVCKAGGAFTLVEAAEALQISERAMQQRLLAGMVLGVILTCETLLPKLQFTEADGTGRLIALHGIDRVVESFHTAKAGSWSALQFLLEPDPNLATAPIEALRTGQVAAVKHAARAFLRLDEE
ncbi:hypothetical protein JMJ56_29980 [Belnapia sp. T18]|uniref:Uncharacterized protein n=1 Tax=Belnapia arida TaxID=2804533 RepID=A0ABS1UBZ6_9PROT|nr:hypothetical protein [Belnapia arida]MBL6082208.1 hypothetical protein [Belnapia arida]